MSFWPFGSAKPPAKPLALTIDDDAALRQLIREILGMAGFEAIEAPNGIEGVKLAALRSPGLILLDMMMPKMGGLETLKLLKEDPKTRPIPVIMVTAEQTGKDVDSAFSLGAAGYVIKPIRPDALLRKVNEVLKR